MFVHSCKADLILPQAKALGLGAASKAADTSAGGAVAPQLCCTADSSLTFGVLCEEGEGDGHLGHCQHQYATAAESKPDAAVLPDHDDPLCIICS